MHGHRHVESGIGAVRLDWAGTSVDFGCFAPTESIVETFAKRGVALTFSEVRGPTDLEKREHLRRLLSDRHICFKWREETWRYPGPHDADSLYGDLEPRLIEAVKRHSAVIPGATQLVDELRSWGVRIGSTTGYLHPIMEILTDEAAQQGFVVDALICPSEVPAGRPYPWMCFHNAIALGVFLRGGESRLEIPPRHAGMFECRTVDSRGDTFG
jgi:phosphonoacetaldehyde hydrolase